MEYIIGTALGFGVGAIVSLLALGAVYWQLVSLRRELREELGKAVAGQILDTPIKTNIQSGTEGDLKSNASGRRTMWD